MVRSPTKVKSKKLLSRLGGVSAFGFGASWRAPEPERDIVRRVITQLEDKRVLHVPYDYEIRDYVEQSLLQIRSALSSALGDLNDNSAASESLRVMRAACREFLNKTPHARARGHFGRYGDDRETDIFFTELGMLRAIFGQQIAVLGYLYDVDIEEGLASILPPAPE